MSTVIVPGSYDPVTLGHIDVIKRAAAAYDGVYAVVFVNPEKNYMFSVEDRVRMLLLATDGLENVIVSYSNGYVVDYMREHNIEKIVKGYRNTVDLEYERVQARYNMKHGGYETELLPADENMRDVSSTRVREAILNGGELSGLLPVAVAEYVKRIRI